MVRIGLRHVWRVLALALALQNCHPFFLYIWARGRMNRGTPRETHMWVASPILTLPAVQLPTGRPICIVLVRVFCISHCQITLARRMFTCLPHATSQGHIFGMLRNIQVALWDKLEAVCVQKVRIFTTLTYLLLNFIVVKGWVEFSWFTTIEQVQLIIVYHHSILSLACCVFIIDWQLLVTGLIDEHLGWRSWRFTHFGFCWVFSRTTTLLIPHILHNFVQVRRLSISRCVIIIASLVCVFDFLLNLLGVLFLVTLCESFLLCSKFSISFFDIVWDTLRVLYCRVAHLILICANGCCLWWRWNSNWILWILLMLRIGWFWLSKRTTLRLLLL